jgi:hypothetical protein
VNKNNDKVSTIKKNTESNKLSTKLIDMTKSILLGVTCGQFDLKNTKVCPKISYVKINSVKILNFILY